jgi:ELWxxDGT repeat protein
VGLWRSDGTAAGTLFLHPFQLDFDATSAVVPMEFTPLGNRLFFVGDDGVHGRQLWQTDGTVAGTALVRLLVPNSVSGLAAAGDRLYFTADDGVHGFELWTSDGTAAGTRLVQDIAPEAGSSSPAGLTVAGGKLYFSADDGLHGDELWSLPLGTPAGCQPAADHLCLAGGRFKVEATWRDFQGNSGIGMAAPLTTDTGYFWFFNPANVEVVVKVLDGRSLNQSFWVFYGALSSVEYTLTVTDTQTGLTRRYDNPSSQLASVADTDGFGPLGAFLAAGTTASPASHLASAIAVVSTGPAPAAAPDLCTPAADRLCLAGRRFSVTATWKDFQGHTGTGMSGALTDDTGYFWFFAPENVEVVAKVLDGRAVNGKFWLFYGALSSVEYTLTVTDLQTGAMRVYKNASGNLASVADTAAF